MKIDSILLDSAQTPLNSIWRSAYPVILSMMVHVSTNSLNEVISMMMRRMVYFDQKEEFEQPRVFLRIKLS